jgi:hypothetical protein
LLAKVKDLSARQSEADPYTYSCKAPGIPRIGPPQHIIQSERELAFIYSDTNGNYWRIVPVDGRPHNAEADASYLGDSVGHWEGDTLVVDVTNFNDDTWLSRDGSFHSTALHVTERLTRRGGSLVYEVTVEDPKVLTGPGSCSLARWNYRMLASKRRLPARTRTNRISSTGTITDLSARTESQADRDRPDRSGLR